MPSYWTLALPGKIFIFLVVVFLVGERPALLEHGPVRVFPGPDGASRSPQVVADFLELVPGLVP